MFTDLNIAMLMDKPLPDEHPTGIGVSAFNLAKALSKLGVRVHLICRGKEETKINNNLRARKISHFTRDHAKLVMNLHKEERFNVIHTTSSSTIPVLLVAKAMHVPTLFHYAEVWKLPPTKMIRQRIMFTLTNKIISVSNNTKNEIIEKFHVDKAKIDVIYNGVDLDLFRPKQLRLKLKEELRLEGFDQILLTVGMLQERKGQHYVIRSLPSILERFPSCCYVNAGGYYSEEYLSQLKDLIAKMSLTKQVRFVGPLPQDKLVELINLADVCVHPALHEGFGLAIVEEMACKKPVVAFNNSSIPEIIDHMKNGVLVKTGDIEGLTSAIIELLSDRQLSKTLAENARKTVEGKFTWHKAAIEFLNIYKQICR